MVLRFYFFLSISVVQHLCEFSNSIFIHPSPCFPIRLTELTLSSFLFLFHFLYLPPSLIGIDMQGRWTAVKRTTYYVWFIFCQFLWFFIVCSTYHSSFMLILEELSEFWWVIRSALTTTNCLLKGKVLYSKTTYYSLD